MTCKKSACGNNALSFPAKLGILTVTRERGGDKGEGSERGYILAICVPVAVAVIAVYKTFDNFDSIWAFVGTILDILSPFVTGFGLAFLLFAPSRFLENKLAGARNRFLRKGARPIAIAVVYLALLLIVAVILIFALPALARALIGFLKTLPDYYKTAMDWVEQYTRPGGVLENFDVPGKLQELYDNVLSKINMDTITASLQGDRQPHFLAAQRVYGLHHLGLYAGQPGGAVPRPARRVRPVHEGQVDGQHQPVWS